MSTNPNLNPNNGQMQQQALMSMLGIPSSAPSHQHHQSNAVQYGLPVRVQKLARIGSLEASMTQLKSILAKLREHQGKMKQKLDSIEEKHGAISDLDKISAAMEETARRVREMRAMLEEVAGGLVDAQQPSTN